MSRVLQERVAVVSQGGEPYAIGVHQQWTGSASAVPILDRETVDGSLRSGRWMVVIFNNDTNSIDEVVAILMAATGCDFHEAMTETWEADTFGKAPVHFASKLECELVAGVIERVGVKTEVRLEWEE